MASPPGAGIASVNRPGGGVAEPLAGQQGGPEEVDEYSVEEGRGGDHEI